eukprot:9472758-Pyramimonas_sp.AAC.1
MQLLSTTLGHPSKDHPSSSSLSGAGSSSGSGSGSGSGWGSSQSVIPTAGSFPEHQKLQDLDVLQLLE